MSTAAGGAVAGDPWAARFADLASGLKRVFARPPATPLSDMEFNAMALRGFAFQFEYCGPYGAFCRRRGHTPGSVTDWREIPAVPASAFKHLDLVSGDPANAELSFRTSGTTRGPGARGVHRVMSGELYAASLLPPFGEHLVPEGGRLPVLCLLPHPDVLPDSSLTAVRAGSVRRSTSTARRTSSCS